MKPVVQLERTGCGIASVATVAGVSYRAAQGAAEALGISARDERLWSGTAHVRRLLAHYGIEAARGEQPFRSWDTLPDLALLAIKWQVSKGRASWHWVVFVRDAAGPRVLDPKRTLARNVRTDFARMQPRWAIALTRGPARAS